jgi:TolA-binding protein
MSHRGRWEDATLALLRVPILHASHRGLSARSLLDAGQSLQKLDRTRQAAGLYRELLADYPQSHPAREARTRLEEMAQKGE